MSKGRFVFVNSEGVLGVASELKQQAWELDGIVVTGMESGAHGVDELAADFVTALTALKKTAGMSLEELSRSATTSMQVWEHAEAALTRAAQRPKQVP